MSTQQEKIHLRLTMQKKLEKINTEKNTFSSIIGAKLAQLPRFQFAQTKNQLMIYLSFGNEVQTTSLLPEYNENNDQTKNSENVGDSVIVPYCEQNAIIPIRIFSPQELEVGRFGIMEPTLPIRQDIRRCVGLEQLDVVLVPGLAFDTHGNRLGHGKGYYDRLLKQLPQKTTTIALAFECQLLPKIPVDHNDQPVNIIITEKQIIHV